MEETPHHSPLEPESSLEHIPAVSALEHSSEHEQTNAEKENSLKPGLELPKADTILDLEAEPSEGEHAPESALAPCKEENASEPLPGPVEEDGSNEPLTPELEAELALEHVPGYLSVKEAARILGVSERSVYGYIETGKLPGARIGSIIVVISDSVHSYERKAPGRMRTNTPLWRTPPPQNTQLLTTITARVRPGQGELLEARLYEIRVSKKHRLLGTSARYITRSEHDPDEVEIILIWRSVVMPPTDIREAALGALYDDLADIIDWGTLSRKESRVLMHA